MLRREGVDAVANTVICEPVLRCCSFVCSLYVGHFRQSAQVCAATRLCTRRFHLPLSVHCAAAQAFVSEFLSGVSIEALVLGNFHADAAIALFDAAVPALACSSNTAEPLREPTFAAKDLRITKLGDAAETVVHLMHVPRACTVWQHTCASTAPVRLSC